MVATPTLPDVLADRLQETQLPQKPFSWNRTTWEARVADVPDALEAVRALPDKIDRVSVREAVQKSLTLDRVLGGLLPVLIWGGPGGFGAHRARSILTGVRTRMNIDTPVDDSIRGRLIEGANLARDAGAHDAFYYMNNQGKIRYLGGAFFTKWLSFSSMTHSTDDENVLPILDKRVRDWIAQNTFGAERLNLSTTSTVDYCRYMDALKAWGAPSHRTPAQVELAIFELTRDRPPKK